MAEETKDRRGEETEGSEIKVTDRRLFTLEGDLRQQLGDADEVVEAGPPTSRTAEPTREGRGQAGFERRSLDEPEGVDFTMLINAMAQPALIFLGEIPHPGTGRPEVNLEQARMQIDLLARNLAMFTKYSGLNVLAGSPTVRFDDATYPLTRTFTGVITLTF